MNLKSTICINVRDKQLVELRFNFSSKVKKIVLNNDCHYQLVLKK